ncbi:hypothetical protein [Halorubrum halodurans]|uniref:Uncharacterized protein n=1 Tax=Halorubrum halodurans TaxID=1383851 RepID=A0A256IJH6_9EURY|nr:hypothetical protein [Halorubrum halodurans]OYR56675.1 hypothetical protein DJ70_08135 [Halorubrum halodurans]
MRSETRTRTHHGNDDDRDWRYSLDDLNHDTTTGTGIPRPGIATQWVGYKYHVAYAVWIAVLFTALLRTGTLPPWVTAIPIVGTLTTLTVHYAGTRNLQRTLSIATITVTVFTVVFTAAVLLTA